jgi:uncharacterized membrane protein YeaQ/YmgE (transglycosylase-associated protein family)
MVISVNGSPVTLDVDNILLWCLIGLVAGFLASHVALGHGMGLIWDIVGALIGGIVLAGMLHFTIAIAGHPIISAMIMAFIGAFLLLIVFRLFARGGYRRRAF